MAKKRKFAEGGDMYNPDQDIADAQSERDAGSFGAAFKAAQKDEGNTFMWRGKRYTKDMAKPKPKSEPKAEMAEVTVTGKRGVPSALDRDEDKLPRVQRKGESAEDYMDPTGAKRAAVKERDRRTAEKLASNLGGTPARAGLSLVGEGLAGGLGAAKAAEYWRDKASIGELIRSGKFGGYKKGGKVKKYAEGGNVNYSANEVSRMKPATPENTKRLQDRARKLGASEASIAKATKGYARGGGIESRGKTRGKFV